MSQLIQPILDAIRAIVTAAPLGALKPFVNVYQGELPPVNTPCAFVIPRRTTFPNEGEGNTRYELHLITVRFAISGGDPQQLTHDCVAYVAAVDAALQSSFPGEAWPVGVLRPFIMEHDYGQMYKLQSGGLAYYPALDLTVAVEELS